LLAKLPYIHAAYNVGRWQQMQRVKDTRPYLRYSAVNDHRTRPAHRAMHGKIFPADHPIWNIWYPPNGFRCRCSVNSVSEDDLELEGWKVETKDPTGKLYEPTDPYTGNKQPARLMMPDAGWMFNPGKAAQKHIEQLLKDKLGGFHPEIARQLRDEMATPQGLAHLHDVKDYKSLDNLMKDFAGRQPQAFNAGYRSIIEADSDKFFMATRPASGRFYVSSQTFPGSGDFSPSKDLIGAMQKIRNGKALTFNEEYSVESLWHEINHNRARGNSVIKGQNGLMQMETLNQFVSRHTYPDFIQTLGGRHSIRQIYWKKGMVTAAG
jgi:hypothetical protein